jgi:hypothetical protein
MTRLIRVRFFPLFFFFLFFVFVRCPEFFVSFLFPLNEFSEAAEVLRSNRKQFEQNVQKTLRGGNLNGVVFDTVVTGR